MRPSPAIIAGSSSPARSPCSSTHSVTSEVIAGARPLGMTASPASCHPATRRRAAIGSPAGSGREEGSIARSRRPVSAPVGKERDENRQCFAQGGAVDKVEHAARQQLFRRPGGLPARLPATGRSWLRLGQDDVRLVRQRRPGRARRRMRQHADERHPGAVEARRGGGDLGRLNQPQQPLLGRAPPAVQGDQGRRRAAADSMARRIFSPATGPMLAPRKA